MNRISPWYVACTALVWTAVAGGAEEHVSQSCRASASLDYFQRGAEAEAEITVDNPQCAKSSGSFVVEVTIRADGETESRKLKFEEAWARDDGQPVVLQRRYAIGDSVQLIRIRIRRLSCACDEETHVD